MSATDFPFGHNVLLHCDICHRESDTLLCDVCGEAVSRVIAAQERINAGPAKPLGQPEAPKSDFLKNYGGHSA